MLENIPIQKVKDKIKEEKMPLTIVGGIRNKKILEYGISLGRMQVLQELIEEGEEKQMGKIYKGWELIQAIADGEIKNGSRFNVHRTYNSIAVLEDRILHLEDGSKRILTTNDLLIYTFELIEDEIDIDSIEELNDTCYDVNIMSE